MFFTLETKMKVERALVTIHQAVACSSLTETNIASLSKCIGKVEDALFWLVSYLISFSSWLEALQTLF
jgi:hypothetical protein